MNNPLFPLLRPIRFDLIEPQHIRPAVDLAISLAKEKMALIVGSSPSSDGCTYIVDSSGNCRDFIACLDIMTRELSEVMMIIAHLEGVSTSDELRKANSDVQADISSFCSSVSMNLDLWEAVKRFASSKEGISLSGSKKRLLDQTIRGFQTGGVDLPQDKKDRLTEIGIALAEACTKFSQNSLDSTNAWEKFVTEDLLSGVPESDKNSMREEAKLDDKDGFKLTLKAPCLSAVMVNANNRSLREEVYLASNMRGATDEFDNRPLIREILQLRKEESSILGFANFADMVLEDRMAKTGEGACSLMAKLKEAASKPAAVEAIELQTFRDSLEGNHQKLEMWDLSYYSEKMSKSQLSFDEEKIREYFPFDSVLNGVFEVVNRLYGIEVIPYLAVPTWNSDVKTYAVYDSGNYLGQFYVDPFSRDNKSEGAWMQGMIDGIGEKPIGSITMNFTKPIGDKPSLLRLNDVETFFHEFGHLMHHMLGKSEYHSHFGTQVAWDFVELPSQLMENFVWDWDVISSFAKHFETGESLPRDLFDKMLSTRKFRAATFMMKMLAYSDVDLMLHMNFDPNADQDVISISRDFMQPYFSAEIPKTGDRLSSFTHIFGDSVGYAAGYYSYKWAELLDADVFTKFQELGSLSREAGDFFREKILSRGDEDDASQLFRDFMGRNPDINGLMERYGF